MHISPYTTVECEKIAEASSLRYIKSSSAGIVRKKFGKGFAYYFINGKKIEDKNLLKRIKSLAIPPAYHDVWICRYSNGHIQATGRDNRNRKQYIYHPLWKEIRQQKKFSTMIAFGKSLSIIREHITLELSKKLQLTKTQIICAIIYLLDNSCIRIGNSIYAKTNKSYGLTTLRKKHLSVQNNKAVLDFMGKNSQLWHVILKDKNIIKLLKKCEEIPGYELFKYFTEDGEINIITSQDVNGYLRALTKQAFTAKDFRTWIACREIFYRLVSNFSISINKQESIKATVAEVANLLGHTPSICEKSYIDPDIFRWWEDKRLLQWAKKHKKLILEADKDRLLLSWLRYKNRLHQRESTYEK